jgi:voltage-gated potassium channel
MTRSQELTDFVCTAAALFYCAEQPENPAVKTYFDALHYVSTSLSVGYANIFPVTQAGKAIGAVVQMVGPAMSSKALEPAETGASLDDVLAELKKITAALPAAL